jgi:Arc/MetJ family transcription regulator
MEDMRPSAGISVNVQVAVAAGTAPRQLLRTDDDLLRTAAEIIEASRMQKQVLEGEYEFVEKSPTAQVKVAITKSSPQS